MNIIQITDLHIGKEGEIPHDVDVRQNFLTILSEIKKAAPDLLILTGDLCLDIGEKEIYKWIKLHLDNSKIPYEVIAGNHDDSVLMADVFEKNKYLNGSELFFKKEMAGKICLFLDTAIGELSENQLTFIEKELPNDNQGIIIFMHHPPVDGGVVFMERKYAMRNRAAFQKILLDFGAPVNIFCGHYHVEKTISYKNITTHITPSCYVQIDMKATDFVADHHRIAFREIELKQELIMSSVHYFKGS